MPGLCGFVVREDESERTDCEKHLQSLLDDLRHHPGQQVLPAFYDGAVAAGQVLWQPGLGGSIGGGQTVSRHG